MKHRAWIGLALIPSLLISCGDRPEEVAIKEFVQRVDANTTIDLSMNILETTPLGPVLAGDSVKYIDSVLTVVAAKIRDQSEMELIRRRGAVRRSEIELKYETNAKMRELIGNQLKLERDLVFLTERTIQHIDSGKFEHLNSVTGALTEAVK